LITRALTVLLLTASLLALPRIARGQDISLPVVEQASGVVVRAEAGMEGLAKDIVQVAPEMLERIAEDLPSLPRPETVEIRLVKRSRDLGRAAPAGRGAPHWAAGVAYPDMGVVVVAYRQDGEAFDVESVVAHELAHLALGAALRGRAPRWLNEGFAYLHSSDWSFARMRTLTGMAWSGNVIPLYELDRSFPAEENAANRAYAQSYDLVAFMARRGRYRDPDDDGDRWPFRMFLAELATGASLDDAARRAYNASMRELADEWVADLKSRYLLLPAGMVGLGVWVLAAILLVIGYIRRKRINRRTLARWEIEEAAHASTVPEVEAS
jgi:hypothetical protein